jgi:hypothetical protein
MGDNILGDRRQKMKLTNINRRQIINYFSLFLFIFPSLIWIFIDKTVWPWDQASYGHNSLELFYSLVSSPWDWIKAMMLAGSVKAPGIAWLGQFFVPLGIMLGSIDIGLLLSILLIQFLVLVLVFESLKKLSNDKKLIAITASLIVASAPLFVGMSHQYFVEPMQTLAIAWFILIASFAPKSDSKLIIVQLLAASSLAMLAKITSPLYCFGYGLIALVYVCKNRLKKNQELEFLMDFSRRFMKIKVGGALILTLGTITWYITNFNKIINFALQSSGGDIAELYGTRDTFINKLFYWLNATQSSFFFPGILVLLTLICLTGLIRFLWKKNDNFNNFNLCAVVSLIHICVALTVFSLSVNEETRYILPLIPHVAIIVSWGLTQINKQIITGFMTLVLILQLSATHAQALGIIQPNPNISPWLYPIEENANNMNNIEEIARQTCTAADRERYNIVGVELPWLNLNSVSYFAAKQRLKNREIRCYYTFLGYAETDPTKAWQRMLDLNINYFIALNRSWHSPSPDAFNQISLPIMDRVETDPTFKLVSSIDNSKILLYKHIK